MKAGPAGNQPASKGRIPKTAAATGLCSFCLPFPKDPLRKDRTGWQLKGGLSCVRARENRVTRTGSAFPGLWEEEHWLFRSEPAGWHGRQPGFTQKVIGTGQQHGHRGGRLHGADAAGRKVFQVVATERAVARCQGRAALVAQLFGVQLDRQTQRPRGAEYDSRGRAQRCADARQNPH